jgi:trehalose 6-phosphate phosphatase
VIGAFVVPSGNLDAAVSFVSGAALRRCNRESDECSRTARTLKDLAPLGAPGDAAMAAPGMLEPTSGRPAAEPGWALFLDFDGTLVDIAERPDAVVVDPSLTPILSRLKERLGGALALVSGRPIAFLDARLAGAFDAAGLHGIEHRIAGRLTPCRPEDHPELRRAVERLQARFAAPDGILVEDKGCSVAVHWRMAPDRADLARAAAEATAAALGGAYRIQYGKAVAEILPAASGKGWVIERFLEEPPYRGRRPIFVGDDLTDEHGFGIVNARGGVSVRIGEGATIAQCRLATPEELRRSLAEWAAGGPCPFVPTGRV